MSLWWILKCYIHVLLEINATFECNIYLIPKLLNYQGCFLVLHGFGVFIVFIHPVLGNNKWLDWLVPRALLAHPLPLSPPARPSEVEREDGGAGAVDGQKSKLTEYVNINILISWYYTYIYMIIHVYTCNLYIHHDTSCVYIYTYIYICMFFLYLINMFWINTICILYL